MDNNRNAALIRIKAAHDELEIVSEGTGLTISERNELTNAMLALDNLIDSLTYPYERNEPITEASFPQIGPFNTAALTEALSSLSIRSEQDYPPANPERVRHVEIGTGPSVITARRVG
ncbi:hypothetical protein [Bombella saccharophila]|uniref:Uncharacterized protein n=1 Tax=Bombella saccharophila TaxID=2967338 RepID=A0ABT3W9I2_9PROT|nr:hypothetical protein [Bombella saccharophila]MCX5614414.1 hypothetical protein [Bombella saccharophila]